MNGDSAYILSKGFTKRSLEGVGAIAGKPCQIQSITDITGGHRVTFLWVDNSSEEHTSIMDVMDGQDGKGIKSVAVNEESHLIITYTDDTTYDAGAIDVHSAVDSVNGKTGEVTLDASDVGALPDDTEIPSKTSDLTNDSNFVSDANYVHTDNNYDATAKSIVDGVTTALAGKVDKETGKSLIDLTTVVDGASYDSTNHLILFKHQSTTLFSLDAAAFVKDGMVDTVTITGGNLVITFNTDAGKQDISIPITDIFNPANYYDKDDVDGLLADKADKTSVIQFKTTTETDANNLWEETGYYIVNTSDMTNLPTTDASMGYCLEVIRYGSQSNSIVIQIAYRGNPTTESPMYMRRRFNSVWTSWVAVATKNDLSSDIQDVYEVMGKNGAKNLNSYPYYNTTKTADGITFTDNGDGTITVDGTATDDIDFFCHARTINDKDTDLVVANGDYILSGCPSGGTITTYYLRANRTYNGMADVLGTDTGAGTTLTLNGDDYDADTVNLGIFIKIKSGTTVSNILFRPMLRLASDTDATWQPYVKTNKQLTDEKLEEVVYEEDVHGINLFKPDFTTKTSNGVTYTVNGDNSISTSGTTTADARTPFGTIFLEKGTYTLSGNPYKFEGTAETNRRLRLFNTDDSKIFWDDGDGVTFTIDKAELYTLAVRYGNDLSFGSTFKPMIRKAEIEASTYRPYNEQAIQNQLNAQGVLGAKNLLNNYATTKTVNGITFTVNSDKSVTVNGTASNRAEFFICTRTDASNPNVMNDGAYIGSGCPQGGSTSTYMMFFDTNKSDGSLDRMVADVGDGGEFTIRNNGSSIYPSNRIAVVIRIESGVTVTNLTFKPMIRLASVKDNTYVPYAPTNAKLNEEKMSYADNGVLGAKNLVPYPHYNSTRTTNGITFTDNGDGSVTVNGTATAQAGYVIIQEKVFPNGTRLAFNGCPSGGSLTTYWLRLERNPNPSEHKVDDYGEGAELTVQDNETLRFLIIIANGVTCNNLVFRPMIRLASDPDDTYQPYAMTNRELTEKKANYNDLFLPNYVKSGTVYNGDLNDLEPGVVYCGSSATNAPDSWCIVMTFSADNHDGAITSFGAQFALKATGDGMYKRNCANGTWSAWKSVTYNA